MSEEKALYDRLLRNALMLCGQGLQKGDRPDVFIEGASNILAKPDFADTERLRALLKMFEQKSRIVRILNEYLRGARQSVIVRIGSENRIPDLRGCAVIASPCSIAGGAICVVGPTRIEYDRLIGLVEYMAKLLSRVLERGPAIAGDLLRAEAIKLIRHRN
jgi:heat-inducible transcriptional repressor